MKNISKFPQFLTFNSTLVCSLVLLKNPVAIAPNKNKIRYKELNIPSDLLRLWYVKLRRKSQIIGKNKKEAMVLGSRFPELKL